MQKSILKRRGSIDSSESTIFISKIKISDDQNKSDEELINYTIEDDVEMIEKQPKNLPIQIYNTAQLYRLSKTNVKEHQEKIQLAATLITQKKIPFITRKAIWRSFIHKGDAKKYFEKTPTARIEEQIRKDVPRSGHQNKMKGDKLQNMLYRVLSAYAVYNTKIGYTQGMNFICLQIIVLMSLEGNDKDLERDDFEIVEDEEDIFWMFVHIMTQMEDLFIKDIPGIHTRIKVLEEMIKNRCEEILIHLECNQIDEISTCFSQYYFSMLLQGLEKKNARMIFEMYLIFGDNFLQNFIVGTLEFYKYKITRMNGLENLMPFFRDQMFPIYFKELNKLRKENRIIQHFQKQHYFDQFPYYGDYIIWEPKFVENKNTIENNKRNKIFQLVQQGNNLLKKLIGK